MTVSETHPSPSKPNSARQKTRRAIRQAFAELVSAKHNLDEITVTELCQKAEITRGTFYLHYDNIYDVAKELREEIFETFFQSDYDLSNNCDIETFFNDVTKYLKSHTDIYKMLISANDVANFTDHLKRHLYHNLLHCLRHHQNKNYPGIKLDAEFFTDGAVCLIIKFFQDETNFSLDDINAYLKFMFRRIFNTSIS